MPTIIERIQQLQRIGRAVKRVLAVILLVVGVALLWSWWAAPPRGIGAPLVLGALLTFAGVVGVLDPSRLFPADASGE